MNTSQTCLGLSAFEHVLGLYAGMQCSFLFLQLIDFAALSQPAPFQAGRLPFAVEAWFWPVSCGTFTRAGSVTHWRL